MLARLALFALIGLPGYLVIGWRYFMRPPYRVLRNVRYGLQPRNLCDVYLPARAQGPLCRPDSPSLDSDLGDVLLDSGSGVPVVIMVTGGAWTIGWKLFVAQWGLELSDRGFVAIAVDYRNFPQATISGMVADVSTAIRWCAAHAAAFGGDPRRLILVGHSAGAHLLALVVMRSTLARPLFVSLESSSADPVLPLPDLPPLSRPSSDAHAKASGPAAPAVAPSSHTRTRPASPRPPPVPPGASGTAWRRPAAAASADAAAHTVMDGGRLESPSSSSPPGTAAAPSPRGFGLATATVPPAAGAGGHATLAVVAAAGMETAAVQAVAAAVEAAGPAAGAAGSALIAATVVWVAPGGSGSATPTALHRSAAGPAAVVAAALGPPAARDGPTGSLGPGGPAAAAPPVGGTAAAGGWPDCLPGDAAAAPPAAWGYDLQAAAGADVGTVEAAGMMRARATRLAAAIDGAVPAAAPDATVAMATAPETAGGPVVAPAAPLLDVAGLLARRRRDERHGRPPAAGGPGPSPSATPPPTFAPASSALPPPRLDSSSSAASSAEWTSASTPTAPVAAAPSASGHRPPAAASSATTPPAAPAVAPPRRTRHGVFGSPAASGPGAVASGLAAATSGGSVSAGGAASRAPRRTLTGGTTGVFDPPAPAQAASDFVVLADAVAQRAALSGTALDAAGSGGVGRGAGAGDGAGLVVEAAGAAVERLATLTVSLKLPADTPPRSLHSTFAQLCRLAEMDRVSLSGSGGTRGSMSFHGPTPGDGESICGPAGLGAGRSGAVRSATPGGNLIVGGASDGSGNGCGPHRDHRRLTAGTTHAIVGPLPLPPTPIPVSVAAPDATSPVAVPSIVGRAAAPSPGVLRVATVTAAAGAAALAATAQRAATEARPGARGDPMATRRRRRGARRGREGPAPRAGEAPATPSPSATPGTPPAPVASPATPTCASFTPSSTAIRQVPTPIISLTSATSPAHISLAPHGSGPVSAAAPSLNGPGSANVPAVATGGIDGGPGRADGAADAAHRGGAVSHAGSGGRDDPVTAGGDLAPSGFSPAGSHGPAVAPAGVGEVIDRPPVPATPDPAAPVALGKSSAPLDLPGGPAAQRGAPRGRPVGVAGGRRLRAALSAPPPRLAAPTPASDVAPRHAMMARDGTDEQDDGRAERDGGGGAGGIRGAPRFGGFSPLTGPPVVSATVAAASLGVLARHDVPPLPRDVLDSISAFIGASGPYEVVGLQRHYHQRGLPGALQAALFEGAPALSSPIAVRGAQPHAVPRPVFGFLLRLPT